MIGSDSLTSSPGGIAGAVRSRDTPERKGATRWLTPVSTLLLGVVPVLSIPVLAAALVHSHNFAFDFHGWYWPAGRRILHGLSPYALPVSRAYKYPAPGALLVTPFALLPRAVADSAFTAVVLAAVAATLRLLDVRDWRVYGVVMLWQPVVFGWETANLTLLLVFGVAVAWRYRDHALTVGAVTAAVISVKLFLLPLALWLVATRRYAALAWAVIVAVALNVIGWAVLGFGELPRYVRLLDAFTPSAERRGCSPVSLLLHLGMTTQVAYAVALAAAGAIAVYGVLVGRRGYDRSALTYCLAASLLASPLVESHYLALLMIPLALRWRSFNLIWLLPLMLWPAPVDHAANWQQALTLVVAAALVIAAAADSRGAAPGSGPPHLRLGVTRS